MERIKLVKHKDEASLLSITDRLAALSLEVHQIEQGDNREAVARALNRCRALTAEVSKFYARLKQERDRLANLKKK